MRNPKFTREQALESFTDKFQKQCHFGLGGCYCFRLENRLNVEDCIALFWLNFNKKFPKEELKEHT